MNEDYLKGFSDCLITFVNELGESNPMFQGILESALKEFPNLYPVMHDTSSSLEKELNKNTRSFRNFI